MKTYMLKEKMNFNFQMRKYHYPLPSLPPSLSHILAPIYVINLHIPFNFLKCPILQRSIFNCNCNLSINNPVFVSINNPVLIGKDTHKHTHTHTPLPGLLQHCHQLTRCNCITASLSTTIKQKIDYFYSFVALINKCVERQIIIFYLTFRSLSR